MGVLVAKVFDIYSGKTANWIETNAVSKAFEVILPKEMDRILCRISSYNFCHEPTSFQTHSEGRQSMTI